MSIDLYYVPQGAPSRAVMITASAVGVQLNLKLMDMAKGEHLTPEFIKISPQHTVPTLDDNGFHLSESRAILGYLVEQYAKDDSLYPKDPKKRAVVNQMLYFDATVVYQRSLNYYSAIFEGTEPDPAKYTKLELAYQILDKYLENRAWAAGDHLTIADFSLVATVTTIEVVGFDIAKYPNVSKWLAKAKKSIPKYKELNEEGCLKIKEIYDSKVGKK